MEQYESVVNFLGMSYAKTFDGNAREENKCYVVQIITPGSNGVKSLCSIRLTEIQKASSQVLSSGILDSSNV